MAYTSAELITFFTNANSGKAPTAAQQLLLQSYATQTQTGALSDDAALGRIIDLLDGTTSVAVQSYQFFTGSTPSAAGIDYLVDSADNANDLNDATGAYAVLNTENRYINFAINLGASAEGAGRAQFAATYGTLSFRDVVAVAYETIIGSTAAAAAGVDVQAAINFLARPENEAYLRAFVAERAPGVDVELAIRAAVVGQIMSAGATADVGNYNAATERLLTDMMDGAFAGGITNDAGVNLLTAYPNAPTGGKTFTLTTAPDTSSVAGTTGDDVYVATNATLSASDVLNGGAGNDTLQYASSGNAPVVQAGFQSSSIETYAITSDAVGGTTFDASNANGLTSVVNDNSSSDLVVTGLNTVTNVTVKNTSQPSGATVNTTVNYNAAATQGASTVQQVTLENVFNPAAAPGTASVSSVTVNGVETFDVVGAGTSRSNLTSLNSNSLQTVNISGEQGVTIQSVNFAGATGVINASKNSGGVNVTLADSGAEDVTFTGGSGNDRADFSAGFNAKDSFAGGDGVDTIALSQATITGGVGGTVSGVEILEVTGGGTGTVDLSKFAGVNQVVYSSVGNGGGNSLVGASTVSNAGAATTVTLDAGTVAQTLTITQATDTAADAATININNVGAADAVGTITANNTETLVINIADDASVTGTGVLNAGGVASTKAKSITVTSNADVTLGASGGAALTSFDASGVTGKLNLGAGLTTSAAGAVVKLGSSDDTLFIGTPAGTQTGGDTITLGAGKDAVVYTALAQSGDKSTDTITDFVSGTDRLDLTGLGVISSTQFLGTRASFGLSQGALTGKAGQAVFQADTSTLWVDMNGDGQLDANDFRVILTGNSAITAADLTLGTIGNSISLSAPAAVVNATTKTNATAVTTQENDTITTKIANLAGSSVDGLGGTDTVVITDAGVVQLPAAFTNVETLTLANGANTVSFNATNSIKNVNGGTGADDVNVTNLVAGGAVDLGAGADNLTATTGAQLEALVEAANASFSGGADADVITFANGLTTAGLDLSNVSAFETVDLGQAAVGGIVVSKFASGVTTLKGDTTNANITTNLTAAQLDALTTITSVAAGNTFALKTSDTGAVTVDLSDTTFTTLANVDSIDFSSSTGKVTVTIDENIASMTGGAGATDQVNVTADLGAVTLTTTGFEVVSVTSKQTGLTVSNDVTTLNANAGGSFTLGTGGDTANISGTAATTVVGNTGADTVNATGTAAITAQLAGGIDTVNLSTGVSNDLVSFADGVGGGGKGVTAAADRDVINNFTIANDQLGLDINQTTAATASGATPVLQVVGTAGAFAASNAADVTVLNFDMGGSTNVLGGVLDGSALVANTGAITIAANQSGYLVAYDGGNAYVYAYTDANADTSLTANEIALIGTVNNVAVGSLGVSNFAMI